MKSLSDCDTEWGAENEAVWGQHASQVATILGKLNLASSVEVVSHRHSPFLLELCIERPAAVTRSEAAKLVRKLRQHLKESNSDWRINVLLIPPVSSDLPEAVWLEVDRFRVVEYLAMQSAERFDVLEDFVAAYWMALK